MRVNAQTIHSLNGGIDPRKRNSFRFWWDLILCLVVPFIKNRKAQAKGLPKKTLSKMDVILNEYEAEEEPEVHNVMEGPITLNHPPISPQRKRCKFCISSLRCSTDSHTSLSKLSQLKSQCQCCAQIVCPQHAVFLVCAGKFTGNRDRGMMWIHHSAMKWVWWAAKSYTVEKIQMGILS